MKKEEVDVKKHDLNSFLVRDSLMNNKTIDTHVNNSEEKEAPKKEEELLILRIMHYKRWSMDSVYIHIPFCKTICSYCDFCKIIKNDKFINPYLECLDEEIKDKYNDEIIRNIYIGGGTPSALEIHQLKLLFKIINSFNLSKKYEFTFECNLEDVNEELLKILKKGKVNRISIGIESFNKDKLKFMNRSHYYKDALNKINLAKGMGFTNINIDLIYALPNETLKVLKNDLRQFLKLKPTHISTYSLIIEENTKIRVSEESAISEDEEIKMYEYIVKKLKKKKFNHYEISNFALSGFQSSHNLNYWENKEYFGFGLGAHGYIHGVRYENTKSLTKYLKKQFLLKENIISKRENMENELILGLRKIEGVNIKDFFKKYKINIQEVFPIKPLLENKDLIYKDGYISISPDKIYVMNEILLKLI